MTGGEKGGGDGEGSSWNLSTDIHHNLKKGEENLFFSEKAHCTPKLSWRSYYQVQVTKLSNLHQLLLQYIQRGLLPGLHAQNFTPNFIALMCACVNVLNPSCLSESTHALERWSLRPQGIMDRAHLYELREAPYSKRKRKAFPRLSPSFPHQPLFPCYLKLILESKHNVQRH